MAAESEQIADEHRRGHAMSEAARQDEKKAPRWAQEFLAGDVAAAQEAIASRMYPELTAVTGLRLDEFWTLIGLVAWPNVPEGVEMGICWRRKPQE